MNLKTKRGKDLARCVPVKARVRLGDEKRAMDKESFNRSNGFLKVAAAPVPEREMGDRQRLEHLEKMVEKQEYQIWE